MIQQWRYLVIDNPKNNYAAKIEDLLDTRGAEGWELIAVVPLASDNVLRYFFKKAIANP